MNVADLLVKPFKKDPKKVAVTFPKKSGSKFIYEELTFEDQMIRMNQYANFFIKHGVSSGDKVVFFVKPNLYFSTLIFSLFKIGAIPVLIDPGMGLTRVMESLSTLGPTVFIGVKRAYLLKLGFKKYFKSINKSFVVGKTSFLGAKSIEKEIQNYSSDFKTENVNPTDMAAILFTSGGTGKPKGVIYTHEMLVQQTRLLQEEFNLTELDADIPGFPLFSLFTNAMGMTSHVPFMDPSKPSKAKGDELYKNITEHQATFVAGSPAIWMNLLQYCEINNLELPSIKYLVMFGAPISLDIHQRFAPILVNGTTYTPYGATECLPVANTNGRVILDSHKEKTLEGYGTCIGKPFPHVDIRVIKTTHDIIHSLSSENDLPVGSVGEIIVKSSTQTPGYFGLDQKTKMAKIYDGEDTWHRMGDNGRFDEDGNLWFCGRVAHEINIGEQTLYPIPIESHFNKLSFVKKSALVLKKGRRNQKEAVLIIEPSGNSQTKLTEANQKELLDISSSLDTPYKIQKFYLRGKLPVDIRHNIKIDRKELSHWVSQFS